MIRKHIIKCTLPYAAHNFYHIMTDGPKLEFYLRKKQLSLIALKKNNIYCN